MTDKHEFSPKAKPWFSYPRWTKPKNLKGLDARYNKVLRVEKDGEYVSVQFVREDGEVVIGEYKLVGWRWAPTAERAEINEMLSTPPTFFGRGRKPNDDQGDDHA